MHAADAARGLRRLGRCGAIDQPGLHRVKVALDGHRRLFTQREKAAHQAPRVGADAQAAWRRRLFHARREVDGGAADAALAINATAQQHRAGGDARAHGVEASLRRHRRGLPTRFGQHRQRGAHGTFGVVLARLPGAEGGQQAVAGVLQHRAALGPHVCRVALQLAVDQLVHGFGVQRQADGGGAGDIDEEHADVAQALFTRAVAERSQLRLQRPDGGVDDRVAEQPALRMQRSDGLQQRLGRVAHAIRHAPFRPAPRWPAPSASSTPCRRGRA